MIQGIVIKYLPILFSLCVLCDLSENVNKNNELAICLTAQKVYKVNIPGSINRGEGKRGEGVIFRYLYKQDLEDVTERKEKNT